VGSYLDARNAAGRWLLRIDDIDGARCRPAWSDQLRSTLRHFALHHDDEPVWQSARGARYAAALRQLTERDLLFRCRCTRRELAEEGEPCCVRDCRRHDYPLTESSLRLDLSALPALDTVDRSLGVIRFDPNLQRDVVVQRRDGVIAYQLAVVVDDTDQGITDVVRGADLLATTGLQLAIHHALGLNPPRYLHLPVLTEADGSKLAKSRYSAALDETAAASLLRRSLDYLQQAQPPPQIQRPSELLHSAVLSWDPARLVGLSEVRLSSD
jgi:glutamyl-Q tRNA(Asp) synthetase